jgi:hypothetical protein
MVAMGNICLPPKTFFKRPAASKLRNHLRIFKRMFAVVGTHSEVSTVGIGTVVDVDFHYFEAWARRHNCRRVNKHEGILHRKYGGHYPAVEVAWRTRYSDVPQP